MLQIIKTNISNNIIKILSHNRNNKVVIIVKKKQFSKSNILIQNRSIMLNELAFFDFKNIFMIPICQDAKLIKGWDTIVN